MGNGDNIFLLGRDFYEAFFSCLLKIPLVCTMTCVKLRFASLRRACRRARGVRSFADVENLALRRRLRC